MEYSKKHKTKIEMKEILESRNLIVDDISIFDNINYSHIIYKYSKPFYDGKTKYKDGTKLSDLMCLFTTNELLCTYLYKGINRFEHKLKNIVATIATTKSAFEYLDRKFYGDDLEGLPYYNENEFKSFLNNINDLHMKSLKNNVYLSGKTEDNIIPL